MTVDQLINLGGNVSVTMTAKDLNDFGNRLIAMAIEQFAPQKEEKYLKIDEVAKMLGVDRSTLWRWDKMENYLHPVRVGGKPRYRLSDVEKILV